MVTKKDLEKKRDEVRRKHSTFGTNSEIFWRAFYELDDLNTKYIEENKQS